MNRLRLVLMTRRFWPLIGARERMLAALARALEDAGHSVTIVTAAWNPDWPTEISHDGVPVKRVPLASDGMIGTFRYMRGLARWLRLHRREFDLIYVSMLKQEAYVAVGAARKWKLPAVLRAEGGGHTGDAAWQASAFFHRSIKRRCQAANTVVTPSESIEQELIEARYLPERLTRIPNGAVIAPQRTPQTRMAARDALGTAHAVLSLGSDTKLAVYTGKLDSENGLAELIAAWALVLRSRTNVRLWLVGEGIEPDDRLIEQIERLKLRGRCVLVGSFDSVDELLAAADMFVHPSREDDGSIAILEAMAHSLPVVAADIPSNRALIASGMAGLLVPSGDTPAWVAAIESVLDAPPLATQLGTAARVHVQKHFALSTMVTRHIELFEQLTTV